MKKITSAVLLTVMMLFASVATVTTATTIDVSAARRGSGTINAYEQDGKVIQAFRTSVNSYIVASSIAQQKDNAAPESNYKLVLNDNDALQKDSFAIAVNDDYTASIQSIRGTAQAITDKVKEAQAADASERKAILDQIKALDTELDGHMAKRDAAIDLYSAGLEEKNEIFGYVIAGVAGLLAIGVVIGLMNYSKRMKANREKLFGGDPNAAGIPDSDKKMLAQLYESMLDYEKALVKGDSIAMQSTRSLNYEMQRTKAAKESLGSYRSIIFEYAGLIAISEKRTEDAQAHIKKAKELSNGKLYTKTAQEVV